MLEFNGNIIMVLLKLKKKDFASVFFYNMNTTILAVSNNHSSILWRSILLGRDNISERIGTRSNPNISAQR